jgi:hypothetical protein
MRVDVVPVERHCYHTFTRAARRLHPLEKTV